MKGMGIKARNKYDVVCYRDGKVVWSEEVFNMVVNEGLDHILNSYFRGSGYTAAHYLGVKGTGAIAATDTISSHGGWQEITQYNGNRQLLVLADAAGQVVSNANNKNSFTFNADVTIAGIMVTTTADGSGTLYGAADFPAERAVLDGDILVIQANFTQASA